MNAPFRIGAAAILCLVLAPAARGQEARPGDDPTIDRRLDEALRREYGDPNGPPPPPPPEYAPPPPPRVPAGPKDDWEQDPFRVRLGLLASYWPARITDARIGRGLGTWADDPQYDGHAHDLGWAFDSMRFAAWIDLGRNITFELAGSRASIERRTDVQAYALPAAFDNGFGGGSTWGARHERYDFMTIDTNIVAHALNCRWGQLDFMLGARYLEAGVHAGSHRQGHGETVEAGIPMIGIGGALRPVRTEGGEFTLEVYGRGRCGGLDFVERSSYGCDCDTTRSKYLAASVEAEGGLRAIWYDSFGVTAGFRYEYNDIEKRDSDTSKRADWRAMGPFVALYAEVP